MSRAEARASVSMSRAEARASHVRPEGGAEMITVANRIYVNPEFGEAFEQRFRERAGLVDTMPGFVSNQVLRPVNDGDPYVVFTVWRSRQDFMAWVRSDAFAKGHAQSGTLPKEAFTRANVLEMHEVVQDSSRPDLEPEPRGGAFNMH
jgi:heme-degrading monooxygenase HmoA